MKPFAAILFLLISIFPNAQNSFEIKEGNQVTIPFQLINNLIFVPVTINGVSLTFLLDTGVSETTIFSLEDKEMKLENLEKLNFSGLGSSASIQGYKSDLNTAVIAKNFVNNSCALYILLDQGINISSHVGIPVNGILGYHFFKNHALIINYQTKKITVFNDENTFLRKIKKFKTLPISIEKNKPYALSDVDVSKNLSEPASKLLIDLGNSDALWIFPSVASPFINKKPSIDDYLGRGFNGDIFGKRSRIFNFSIAGFSFEKPLMAMPDENSIKHVILVDGRKGSVGGEIMRRFTVGFDYPNHRLYLRKNKAYDEPFHFNMSGLDFEQVGVEWEKDILTLESKSKNASSAVPIINNNVQYSFVLKPVFSVAGVRKDSPGDKAGLEKGDRLISINGRKTSEMTLKKIIEIMKSDEGKTISMIVERKNRLLPIQFTLEDPIPYQE
jgi:hypothetical protein